MLASATHSAIGNANAIGRESRRQSAPAIGLSSPDRPRRGGSAAVRARSARAVACPARRGLAPLEMVLALPLLLMVMALTINVGASGSWKIRAAMVARDVVWSARWPRAGALTQPANWPLSASRNVAPGNPVSVLADSSIDQPVARGPMLGSATVNRNLLDPTTGLRIGESSIQPGTAMLAQALPATNYNLQSPLLDNAWQYQRMGLSSNQQLREPVIYSFPQTDSNLSQAYVNAVTAIYYSPLQAQLITLDQDPEIYAFYGYYKNFYPRLRHFCTLNVQSVRKRQVQQLIYHIEGRDKPHIAGVPETMTNFFTNMYKQMQHMQ